MEGVIENEIEEEQEGGAGNLVGKWARVLLLYLSFCGADYEF